MPVCSAADRTFLPGFIVLHDTIAMAAVTGVVPFVASYWAAVPAILELWLIENSEIQALLLAICHILPTYVVDTVIYSEIEG